MGKELWHGSIVLKPNLRSICYGTCPLFTEAVGLNVIGQISTERYYNLMCLCCALNMIFKSFCLKEEICNR